jgi:hypothetical protein
MPKDDPELSDDYVANLLKTDAKQTTQRYAESGFSSLLRRPGGNSVPKPNTRFLRNLIRETDSHNAALLAKEAQESKAKLKQLKSSHTRRRSRERSRDRDSERRKAKRSRRNDEGGSGDDRDRRKGRRSDSSRSKHDYERRRDKDSRRSRRSESPPSRSNQKSRNRERPTSKRSPSKEHQARHLKRNRQSASVSDSDPLEDLVGPLPPKKKDLSPVRRRGRGAFNSTLGDSEDSRFSKDYDPTNDMIATSDAGDWDEALEVMRTREKWKQSGAERLRQVGFTENQIKKWEKGDEPNESDVKWTKKGESREWDRGKVLDDEGNVTLKPEWGRLKDTLD